MEEPLKVLLFHLDGRLPNLALMRIAAHHRALGDEVELRRECRPSASLFDSGVGKVYASCIFEKSRPAAISLKEAYPGAIIGGTGWDVSLTLEGLGIREDVQPDYSIYPDYEASIGFTQRGCRLKCGFCIVPRKEGDVRAASNVWDVWRGEPHPRRLLLLDNDFFGSPTWKATVFEIIAGRFKVCFCQGINARFLTQETAEAMASLPYYDDQFKTRRIYTAWDNRKDKERLYTGLAHLVRAGVKADHIMVYMLIGYWPGETEEDWEFRRSELRAWGCRPYPMPFVRNPITVGYQRFVVGAYDKRFTWREFREASCRPEKMGYEESAQLEMAV